MLYLLLFPLHKYFSALNVFKYITFRTAYAILTALLISFLLGPWVIDRLKRLQVGESIRADGPQNHFNKAGTPTMGGILILTALFLPTLFWADLTNSYIWIAVLSAFGFGLIGFVDDYMKIFRKNPRGFRGRHKILAQLALAAIVSLLLYMGPNGVSYSTKLSVPFFKNFLPDLGLAYVIFAVLVIVGSSNAVNLTDGLDGLAIGPIIIAMAAYTAISYVAGHLKFAEYLNIVYLSGAGELAVFGGAVVGASLGFLWFNAYPAQLFMGNTGSLALGGLLGTMAVMTKHELLLIIIGGLFVIETLSVILQVISFKVAGKRIFKMAPLHHHYEEKGWAEPKVIVRFWIIAIILALLSLSTLKLR